MVNDQTWLGSGEEHFLDGDNRKIFLRGEKSHVLCCWQLNDDHELLSHSLAKLSDDAKVDLTTVPPTSNACNKDKTKEKLAEKEFRENVSKSFSELARNQTLSQLRQEKMDLRKHESDLRNCDDEDERKELQQEIVDSEKITSTLKKDLNM